MFSDSPVLLLMLLLQVLLAMRTLLGIGLAGTTIGDTLFLEVIPKSQRGRWMMALGLFWVRDMCGAVDSGGEGACSTEIRPSSTPMHDILISFPSLHQTPA